ncbi:MAG: hypothetical protein MUE72_04110 [Chitinophagaceae bacterium]|jgi:hypothetical protein|nr:hypothetical protein [Chitinophagaceae bacterium]
MKRYFLIGIGLTLITCCKKTNSLDAELAKLPPISQTGAKTFGCIVNGKAILPNCNLPNCPPSIEGFYDSQPNGQFGIVCTYNIGKNNIIIGLDSIFSYKSFLIKDSINKNVRVSMFNTEIGNSCERVGYIGALSNFNSITGNVNLTRVDVPNGIFSGTFNFTIKTQNCGNYEVTNGRFDYKF